MDVILLLVIAVFCVGSNGHDWNYDTSDTKNGPANWKAEYPACGGNRQTPIAIKTEQTEHSDELGPFTFVNYDNMNPVLNLTNNGDRAKLIPVSNPPKISGAHLPGNYSLYHLHFHWGESNDKPGSEHRIDDEVFAGEVHIVHLKDGYGAEELANKSDALAVISILLKAGGKEHHGYKKITDNLDKIKKPGDLYTLEPFKLKELLPHDKTSYFHFHGSRNVPPCSEVVIWSLMREPVVLSDEQFNKFRQLTNEAGPIMYNVRPIQPTNGRSIHRSWQRTPTSEASRVGEDRMLATLLTSVVLFFQLPAV